MTDGDPLFTLTQVALNDTIMVFAFALVLLFGFQGEAILEQPPIIALLAVPILSRCSSTPALPIG